MNTTYNVVPKATGQILFSSESNGDISIEVILDIPEGVPPDVAENLRSFSYGLYSICQVWGPEEVAVYGDTYRLGLEDGLLTDD
jgi:hypothetical protein